MFLRSRTAVGLAALAFFPLICEAGLSDDLHGHRRVALVIGNAAYAAAPLKNPVNDARDLSAALRSLGFEVRLATNVTNRELSQTISQFASSIRPGDIALFFWSGHGVQVEGENYLIPVDFSPQSQADVKYDTFSLSRVVDKMEASGASMNIVLVDACRNNPFISSRSATAGLASMNVGKGIYIAFATAPGGVADDDPLRSNGVFTGALLKSLKQQPTDIDSVFKRVRTDVALATRDRQIPWTTSSVVGDFSFSPAQTIPEAATSPTITGTVKSNTLVTNSAALAIGNNSSAQLGGISLGPTSVSGNVSAQDTSVLARITDANVMGKLDSQRWEEIKSSKDIEDFRRYLRDFPTGVFGDDARRRVEDLRVDARVELQLARMTQGPNIQGRPGERSVQPLPHSLPTASPTNRIAEVPAKPSEADLQMKRIADQMADLKERQAWTLDIVKYAFPTLAGLATLMLGMMGLFLTNLKGLVPSKPEGEATKVTSKDSATA